ncbi:alpha/beta fold hydrolase [Streptomyces sp. NPDC051940]|uniref:esterase/lipase family protein n=1 Tax=Streptomyces sp. NPDC051940 TaxID=3155675 RepID=UPI00342F844E
MFRSSPQSVGRRRGNLRSALAALAALPVLLLGAAVPASAGGSGPALNTPAATLNAALSCSANLANATRTPVLLIHGTSSTPQESWSWGYQRALGMEGYPVCTVTLPERSGINVTVQAEYVVNAVRSMYGTSGRKIAMLGHSQGAFYPLWVLRFWPDLAAKVDDAVALAGPLDGAAAGNVLCVTGSCPEVGWQLRQGSDTIAALRRAPLPAGPAYSSIATYNDEIVFPQPSTARMPGVTTSMIQDVCPLRVVGHAGLLADAVGYALFKDAITHTGPADADRVSGLTCFAGTFDNVDLLAAPANIFVTGAYFALNTLTAPKVGSEPPLPAYALNG